MSKALNVHVNYSTVPVTDPDKIEELEAIFPELDPWQDNYGATAFCTPKFSKYKPLYPDGDDDVWTRLDFCIIAYEDHELNGVFSSFE